MIKLIAKPDTWFKASTEVMIEDNHYGVRRLYSMDEYHRLRLHGDWGYVFRGTRVVENPLAEGGPHLKIGEEREDGEICSWDEFDVVITEDHPTDL